MAMLMDQVLISTPDNPAPDNRTEGYFETFDGQKLRYAVFRSNASVAKGTVVLLQGRNEYIEKYFETIRDLTARGLWVATFDLRGQGGSPRLVKKRQHGHVRRFSDYERDLDIFLEKVVLPDTRLPFYILAHSTGALIALSAAPYLATRIERMVLSAPFIGLIGQAASASTIRRLASIASTIGLGSMPLTGKLREPEFRDNPLTSDEVRFERNASMMRNHPELTLGPPTARWLVESFRTIDKVMTPNHLFSITIPTVVIAPTRDGVVPYIAQERLSRYFRAGQLVPINGARHEIFQERDAYRAAALAAFHAFIPGSDAEAEQEVEGIGV
jgi:lysophospholipase